MLSANLRRWLLEAAKEEVLDKINKIYRPGT
jgi:hypothetical protein